MNFEFNISVITQVINYLLYALSNGIH